jgi:hypothetical protein
MTPESSEPVSTHIDVSSFVDVDETEEPFETSFKLFLEFKWVESKEPGSGNAISPLRKRWASLLIFER